MFHYCFSREESIFQDFYFLHYTKRVSNLSEKRQNIHKKSPQHIVSGES